MRPTKRDELVSKALSAFYRAGFQAIGMDRLAVETGVSKTSMYKHFRTKEDLIQAALRLRDEQFRNWLFRRIDALGDTSKLNPARAEGEITMPSSSLAGVHKKPERTLKPSSRTSVPAV